MRTVAVTALALLLASCSVTASPTSSTTAPSATTTTSAVPVASTTVTADGPPPGLDVVVEPDDGIEVLYRLLSSPQHSLSLAMYELVDPQAEAVLAADAIRGVDVKVLLDSAREREANTSAHQYLSGHGVHVMWASGLYEATHEKAVVIDAGYPDQKVVIMTLNLTARYYPSTRDIAVVDSDPADVAAVDSTFGDDFAAVPVTPSSGADLLWSPGSQPELVDLIGGARVSLLVENEEMSDLEVVDALAAAARRGVSVEVVMTADRDWTRDFAVLSSAGVQVRTVPDDSSHLYIHAKAIVVDGSAAFVGSENFSVASLSYNRELGLVMSQPAAVSRIARVLASDFSAATPWTD